MRSQSAALHAVLEEAELLPLIAAIQRLVAAHDDFLRAGDAEAAAQCIRGSIIRAVREQSVEHAFPLAEQLLTETTSSQDAVLCGLLRERAGLATQARDALILAKERATSAAEHEVVSWCLSQQVGDQSDDPDDAATQVALGQAYLDMGLRVDALRTLLVGFRRHPHDWGAITLLVDKLVSGELMGAST